jgi:hypothetical protein
MVDIIYLLLQITNTTKEETQMKIFSVGVTAFILIFVLATSFQHTVDFFEAGGNPLLISISLAIACELIFVFSTISVLSSRMKQKPVSKYNYGLFVFGLLMITSSNIYAGWDFGALSIIQGASIPLSLLLLEGAFASNIIQFEQYKEERKLILKKKKKEKYEQMMQEIADLRKENQIMHRLKVQKASIERKNKLLKWRLERERMADELEKKRRDQKVLKKYGKQTAN